MTIRSAGENLPLWFVDDVTSGFFVAKFHRAMAAPPGRHIHFTHFAAAVLWLADETDSRKQKKGSQTRNGTNWVRSRSHRLTERDTVPAPPLERPERSSSAAARAHSAKIPTSRRSGRHRLSRLLAVLTRTKKDTMRLWSNHSQCIDQR